MQACSLKAYKDESVWRKVQCKKAVGNCKTAAVRFRSQTHTTTTNQAYIIFRIHIRITSVALQCGNAALFNNRVPHHGADDAI